MPFLAFYSAFDASVGLSGGLLARYVLGHPTAREEVSQAADTVTDPLSAPVLAGIYAVAPEDIFTKTGVRARCDLVTKIFFAHYEPRLRDNEQRTAANLPLRGGRLVPTARIAAPAGDRLSQQQSELRARQSEDRFGPMLALTRPQL